MFTIHSQLKSVIVILGYPRIYRRLLEGLRKSNVGPEDKKIVRMTLKESLRFPTTAHRIFKSSETLKFLHFYKDNVLKNAGSAPDFFVSLAKDLEHNAGLIFGTAIRILTRK